MYLPKIHAEKWLLPFFETLNLNIFWGSMPPDPLVRMLQVFFPMHIPSKSHAMPPLKTHCTPNSTVAVTISDTYSHSSSPLVL